MDTNNLEDVILSSIEDVELPADDLPPIEGAQADDPVAPVEATEAPTSDPVETPDPTPVEEQVASPAAKQAAKTAPKDDFEKKYGIPARSESGRENRIPHSRVTKIVAKAAKEATDLATQQWEPKVQELTTKLQTYEQQLGQHAQFNRVLAEDPVKFLDEFLVNVPAYKPFFDKVRDLLAREQSGTLGQPAAEQAPVADGMPEPDEKLPDGTMVYSMDGLRKLNAWTRAEAVKEAREAASKEVNDKYGTYFQEKDVERKIQSLMPGVQRQIAEARQWPQFNENEQEIVKALQGNSRLTLEGAYRQVVFPKLSTDRNKVREEVMAEIKKAPRSTSPAGGAVKPVQTNEPRSIEDAIMDSIRGLKR